MARRKLESVRLSLDPITPDDVAVLVRHWSEEAVRRYLWNDAVIDDDTVSEVVATSDSDFERHGYGIWALRTRDADALIGMCGLRGIRGQTFPELMYSLRPRFWGHGLAQEAATRVLTYAFEELAVERVLAAADPGNINSARVLKRLGMLPFDEIRGVPFASVTHARFQELQR